MKKDKENIEGSPIYPKSATSPTNENNLRLNIVNKRSERGEKVQFRTLNSDGVQFAEPYFRIEFQFHFLDNVLATF